MCLELIARGGRIAGGPFAGGLIAGWLFASGLNAATLIDILVTLQSLETITSARGLRKSGCYRSENVEVDTVNINRGLNDDDNKKNSTNFIYRPTLPVDSE